MNNRHDPRRRDTAHDELSFRADVPDIGPIRNAQTQAHQTQRQRFEQQLRNAVQTGQRGDEVSMKSTARVHAERHKNQQAREQSRGRDHNGHQQLNAARRLGARNKLKR